MTENDNITFSRLALALANDYESVFCLNIEDDSYVEYVTDSSDKHLSVRLKGTDFFADTIVNCRKMVYEPDQERFIATLRKEAVIEALKNGGSFTLKYRLIINGHPEYYSLKTIRGTGPDDHFIIIGVRNIDEQERRDQAKAGEYEKYVEIAKALVSRYEFIYYIDLDTGEYIKYESDPAESKLKVIVQGNDFFGDTLLNIDKVIYPEDRPLLRNQLEKEKFVNDLRGGGMVTLTYRMVTSVKPFFVSFWAVSPKNDLHHAVIGIMNIDAAKRREMEYREALGTAMDIANHDALTGVRNHHAYIKATDELDLLIKAGRATDFAIAIIDVNGLKTVNDTLGHAAGDKYIKSACSIICSLFAHSAVFRIGGDEFAVILKGKDYDNRERIMRNARDTMHENIKKGLVTFAAGISDYTKGFDKKTADVFERADKFMYENKKHIKKLIQVRNSEI